MAEHGAGVASADDRGSELDIDVPGIVLRVRRTCDLSQRELAAAVGLDQSQVARIESARRRIDVPVLGRILALAGYRIAILDRDGVEVTPIPADVLRDNAGRRMPAHLDVRPPFDRPREVLLHPHADRPRPRAWYHHRARRDRRRAAYGHAVVADPPTISSLARLERERRAERARAARERMASLPDPACSCADECLRRGRCTESCACLCE